MRAEIYKIEDSKVRVVTSNDKIVVIPKDKIDFKIKTGDTIVIEKIDGKVCCAPIGKASRKGKKSKVKIVICFIVAILLIIGGILAAMIIPKKVEEKRKVDLAVQLDDCIYAGHKKIYPNSAWGREDVDSIKDVLEPIEIEFTPNQLNEDIDVYDMMISCYSKYEIDGYEDKIDELNSYKEKANLFICVRDAKNSSVVTDEEIKSAEYDAIRAVALLTRQSNGLQEQINCYEKYNIDEYQSKVGELRIKKNEIDSYIESIKSSTSNAGSGVNSYMHCVTNSAGGYTYTNCY